jgi:hypothetical protein
MTTMLDWLDPQTKAFVKDVALGQLRSYLIAGGTMLGTYGVLTTSEQKSQFVTVGVGVATAAFGAAWSWWEKTGKPQMQARMVEIAAQATLKRQAAAAAHVAAAEQESKAKALLAAAQGLPVPPTAP